MVQPIEQHGLDIYGPGGSVRWHWIFHSKRSAGDSECARRSERGLDRISRGKHGAAGTFGGWGSKFLFAQDLESATAGEQSSVDGRGKCRDRRGFLRRFAGGVVGR